MKTLLPHGVVWYSRDESKKLYIAHVYNLKAG